MNTHEALFSETRSRVLSLFFLNPQEEYYVREVARHVGMGHGTVQREVHQLKQVGLLRTRRAGGKLYYQADDRHIAYSRLQSLMEVLTGPVGRIHKALASHKKEIGIAFIYGSIADGSAGLESDIDLLIIGTIPFETVVRKLRPVQKELQREINPSIFTVQEVREKLAGKSPYLVNVMNGPKKFVMGDASELEDLV